jgi:hypothetical protein
VGSGLHFEYFNDNVNLFKVTNIYFLSHWVVSPLAFADRLGFYFVELAHNGFGLGEGGDFYHKC